MPSRRQRELSKQKRKERLSSKNSSKITQIEDIPAELVAQLEERVITRVTAQIEISFQGYLPPPEMYAEYERALPGTADRILKMAEFEQLSRVNLQKDNLRRKYNFQIVGLWLGFVLAFGIAMVGLWIVSTGKPVEGFFSFFSGLGLLVGAAIYRHRAIKSAQKTA